MSVGKTIKWICSLLLEWAIPAGAEPCWSGGIGNQRAHRRKQVPSPSSIPAASPYWPYGQSPAWSSWQSRSEVTEPQAQPGLGASISLLTAHPIIIRSLLNRFSTICRLMTCQVLISWVFISLELLSRALGDWVRAGRQCCFLERGWYLDANKSVFPICKMGLIVHTLQFCSELKKMMCYHAQCWAVSG